MIITSEWQAFQAHTNVVITTRTLSWRYKTQLFEFQWDHYDDNDDDDDWVVEA